MGCLCGCGGLWVGARLTPYLNDQSYQYAVMRPVCMCVCVCVCVRVSDGTHETGFFSLVVDLRSVWGQFYGNVNQNTRRKKRFVCLHQINFMYTFSLYT